MTTRPTRVKMLRSMDGVEYPALVAVHGFNDYPVCVLDGRQCYVTKTSRVFGGKGRNCHDRYTVHFLDDGSVQTIPAGRFNKSARVAPLPASI